MEKVEILERACRETLYIPDELSESIGAELIN